MNAFYTWWTIPTSSLFDWAVVLMLSIPVSLFAGYLGRKYQRFSWKLDKPYTERVRDIEGWKSAKF